jgi:exosortase D (VPLPA-CTERM-specific)
MSAPSESLAHASLAAAPRGRAPVLWIPGLPDVFLLLILSSGLVYVCFSGVSLMWDYWLNAPEYSHAILIPFVAAFLIWQRRPELDVLKFSGSWSGTGLIALGGLLEVMGELGSVYYLVDFGFLVALHGLALSYMGLRGYRIAFVPLCMLVLTIPLPQFLNANLSATLQLWSSTLGVDVIRLFGIAVYQEGNVIDLGGYKLQVVEACAGLRYLYPLITLGVIIAYFFKGRWWQRLLVLVSSIPITVIMNSVRIGIIGVLVERWGSGMAEGFLHDFEGWMVFMLCAALMIGEVMLLARIGNGPRKWRELFGVDFPPARPAGAVRSPQRMGMPLYASAVLVVALAAITAVLPERAEAVPAREAFVDFPSTVDGRQGRRQPLEPEYLQQLKLDDYLLADFSDPAGRAPPINLYVAWYNSQRKGESVHSPRTCLPGGGWVMRDFGQRELANVQVGGHALKVNRAIVEMGNQRAVVYYWFKQRNRYLSNEFAVKAMLFWDALTRNRTDGALVRLVMQLPIESSEAEADTQLARFAKAAEPMLATYVPD